MRKISLRSLSVVAALSLAVPVAFAATPNAMLHENTSSVIGIPMPLPPQVASTHVIGIPMPLPPKVASTHVIGIPMPLPPKVASTHVIGIPMPLPPAMAQLSLSQLG